MFNRIRAAAASLTLITFGTIAPAYAAVMSGESNLSAGNFGYRQDQPFTPPVSDRANPSLSPTNPDSNQLIALKCYFVWCPDRLPRVGRPVRRPAGRPVARPVGRR